MKLLSILTLIICLAFSALGQDLTSTKVDNDDLVYILNNLEKMSIYKSDTSVLYIRVYSVPDHSGSAKAASCDVTTTIYIAVSEYGEVPDQSLFKLSSVYNPKFIKWIPSKNEPALVLSYGIADKRKTVTIKVKLNGLNILLK